MTIRNEESYFDELVRHLWCHVDTFDIKFSSLAVFTL